MPNATDIASHKVTPFPSHGAADHPTPALPDERDSEIESSISMFPPGGHGTARHRQSKQPMSRFLLLVDFGIVWAGAAVVHEYLHFFLRLMPAIQSGKEWPQGAAGFLVLFSVLVVMFARSQGLYDWPWKTTAKEEIALLANSVVLAVIVTDGCTILWNIPIPFRTFVIPTATLTWALLAAWREFVRSQSIAGLTEARNVLIVGCGQNGQLLRQHLEQHPELGYVFKGYLDRREGPRLPDPQRNPEEGYILGPSEKLYSIARAHFIDEVFISIPGDRGLVKNIASRARHAGLHVRVVPDYFEKLPSDVPVEYVGQFPTLTLYEHPIPTTQLIFKRLFDIAVSLALLVAAFPLMLFIAIVVRLDSEGPTLYESLRVGKKGQAFVCYKFRTMVKSAEALKAQLSHLNERDGVLFKISNDPRMTRVGRFLRQFSLDELPQLWNVLKGDMSLVGPRPPVPGEYDQYALEHLQRLDVTPGVTGLWQVEARCNPSFESYIALDKEYVNNWSLWLDCRILWKTVGVVLAGTGQ
jgi:exopolysaccharide biosynthesis polyprenyl glycosylphosphotransferase